MVSKALDDLRYQLEGRKDIGFTGKSSDIIEYAVSLLGPELIKAEVQDDQPFYKPVASAESFIELSYYSNSLVPFFALDSIMVTAIHTQATEYATRNPADVTQLSFKCVIENYIYIFVYRNSEFTKTIC